MNIMFGLDERAGPDRPGCSRADHRVALTFPKPRGFSRRRGLLRVMGARTRGPG